MSLYTQLKEAYIQAMKDKNIPKKLILGVILGEIQNESLRGISVGDSEVEGILRKMEKSLLTINTEDSLAELEIIKPYLPQLMNEEKIRTVLEGFINKGMPKDMGVLMKNFNMLYKGKADNKIVSQLIKELL